MIGSRAIFAGMALALIATPAQAQRHRWETLGQMSLRTGVTSETLRVRRADWPRQVRLCVEGRSVNITEYRLEFSRGGSQRISVRRTIRRGECTFAANIRSRTGAVHSVRIDFPRLTRGTRPLVRYQAR